MLPEPAQQKVWCPVISVDDHVLEPLDLFDDRVPGRSRDAVPRPFFDDDGLPYWLIDETLYSLRMANGPMGYPMNQWSGAPLKMEEFKQAVWDPAARLADMDVCGVWASLNFPGLVWGFAGRRFAAIRDKEAGLAALRAWNRWHLEEWCGTSPDRFIPCQLPWLADPVVAAEEVRRNAAAGFHCVSFSENPATAGFASLYSGAWDPFLGACQETGTVINLHTGSAGL